MFFASCNPCFPGGSKYVSNPILRILAFFTGSLLLLPTSFASGGHRDLTGSITDSSGASVPNASVKVTELSTGVVRSTKTSMDGVYNVPYLSPGVYRVEVEAAGFKLYSQDNVRLEVSTTARLDATLTPGSANETVTVTAEAAALQTDRAEVARNFTTRTVVELPVANRNFQALGRPGRRCRASRPELYYLGGPTGHHVFQRERARQLVEQHHCGWR